MIADLQRCLKHCPRATQGGFLKHSCTTCSPMTTADPRPKRNSPGGVRCCAIFFHLPAHAGCSTVPVSTLERALKRPRGLYRLSASPSVRELGYSINMCYNFCTRAGAGILYTISPRTCSTCTPGATGDTHRCTVCKLRITTPMQSCAVSAHGGCVDTLPAVCVRRIAPVSTDFA